MAESTLSLSFNDLSGETGLFLGYGRGAANNDPPWSSQQQAVIDSCVKSGLRQFYFPPPLQGERTSYDWSFLRPTASLALPNATQVVPLPDDFGGFEGEATLLSSQSQMWWPIKLTSEQRIRAEYSAVPSATGRPLIIALQPIKGTTGTQGQRWQLTVFPQSDAAYTLQFQYYILPDYLTGAFPYALGGAEHVETILESCLAIAEQRLDDSMGVHTQLFQQRLAASVAKDRQSKPQTMGYMRDLSDMRRGYPWRPDLHGYASITVGGTQF